MHIDVDIDVHDVDIDVHAFCAGFLCYDLNNEVCLMPMREQCLLLHPCLSQACGQKTPYCPRALMKCAGLLKEIP